MSHYLYLGLAIIFEVVGTIALRLTDGFSKAIPSTIVVIAYALSFYFLSFTLKTIPVAIAYALWSGIGIILIVLLGWKFLGQALDTPALVGLGFILVGVVVINLFSKSVVH
ncbi:MAG: SMR family transporter [Verrucomicrobiota bacterium]